MTGARPAVEALVAALATSKLESLCNPYAGDTPGARQRQQWLSCYLHAHWAAPILLVGEAAGWRGACRSGVPFTSEHQLQGTGMKEASATIVHRVLKELDADRRVLLWNVVPYHPHAPGSHDSNRPPTQTEVVACQHLLEVLAANRLVIGVGRIAARALPGAVTIRHPSHGGAVQFAAGLAAILRNRGSLHDRHLARRKGGAVTPAAMT
jgi:uracil-DNA glycosylase